jgi:hypothetical protein
MTRRKGEITHTNLQAKLAVSRGVSDQKRVNGPTDYLAGSGDDGRASL